MISLQFESLDWKDFERLCADLLDAEGFSIESEPFVDRTGSDIIATEQYRSHASNQEIHIRWKVQCKHYAGSGNNLGRKEVEESLFNFEVTKRPGEGLFLIVDTDYTEPAIEVIDKYLDQHPYSKVTIWNQRQLATKLERHPHLLMRYGLSLPNLDHRSLFLPLGKLGSIRTLIISDQSAMAHDLTSALGLAGFDITFIPVWNYQDYARLAFMLETVLKDEFKLIICFLGDSFGLPIPDKLIDVIIRCYKRGCSLLFFPFMAWSLRQGAYLSLQEAVPVRLEYPNTASMERAIERIIGPHRRGDFGFMLNFDLFSEDQYIELDPSDGIFPFSKDVNARFGLSHTFEYLVPKEGARVAWKDTAGNPMVIVSEYLGGKQCYLNTCCHSCLSTIPVSSPLEASQEAAFITRNIILWLLDAN